MAEIAVAGAVAVLRQAASVLGGLVVQESSRLFNLKEDLEWLEHEMGYIQAYLEDADANYEQGRGNRVEATLLKNIRGLAYDVEDVVETYLTRIASQDRNGLLGLLKSPKGILNNYKTSHDFAVKIERIKRRVENIKNARQTYGIRKRSARDGGGIWDPRRSFPHIDEVNVVGFDKHIEELAAKVLDKDLPHPVISITGMAGLGKTTLAKKVYNSVLQRFECSAWICVSQQPNIAELLRDIARQVGLEKEKWEHNVEANLFEFLRYKRYVIVIDDLWQIEPWNALKNGIPNNFQIDSRIILTSRNRDVGIHVGGRSSLHELEPLDLENSRKLFFKMVKSPPSPENMKEANDHPPAQFENIGEQILKRCGGVPLAIVLTEGMLLLRERTEHAWKGVLEIMGQEEDQCSKIFALSYKDLPIELKPCFLYFGIFPEDYEIPTFDLINLWVAEGFIQRGSGSMRKVEEVGEDYLSHLIARNLIQVAQRNSDGRIRSCRIHDILHNLCVRVSEEIDFFNTYNDIAAIGINFGTRVRRVTTYRHTLREYISLGYRTPELRAMLCFERDNGRELKRKHVKNFLGDSRFLRVLSLEFEVLIINLPDEFGNLTHLRYIQLKAHFGRIIFPSTISNLQSLLTLDVRRCSGVVIPHCIWKMKQLRHILLNSDAKIKCGLGGLLLNMGNFLHPDEASSLNLQTLYGFRFHRCITKYGFPKFTSLRKLGVYFWDYIEWLNFKTLLDDVASNKLEILRLEGGSLCNILDLNLCRYENLFRLHLEGRMEELPEHDKLPPNLTKLTLVRTHLGEDPLVKLKKLPKLKILKLGKRSYMGQKMLVCSGGGGGRRHDDSFPQLQVLEINQLFYLKELIVEEEAMPQLKALRIRLSDPETRIPDRIRNIMISE